MIAKPLNDLTQLCIHTITTKPWAIEQAGENFSKQGVKGITVWRDALNGRDIKKTGNMLRDQGLDIVSLCRGGFFPNKEKQHRARAIDDNRKAIQEAAELGAPLIVLVCGADPVQSLEDSRRQIREGIEIIVPDALAAGIKLAIEPLHPMYADSRSAINTICQANDMASAINSEAVGVAIDVYHLWWDPQLEHEIERCGKNKQLFAFHICDWSVPTNHLLLDRGLMGDGCIPVNQIRSWVEATGYTGYYEVEIFSEKYWGQEQDIFLQKIIKAYRENS